MRVLKWMLERVEGSAGGDENVFGVSPRYDDISWAGLDFSREQYQSVISIDRAAWQAELGLHGQLFQQLASRLPAQLLAIKSQLQAKLAA